MLIIDGSKGEGGGQVLRSSLSLSLLTGKPFRLDNVRGGRKKPGLLRQHLTALRAAAEISGATIEGDELKSRCVTFRPGPVVAGDYSFAVGSAGSASLVFQTVLPALAMADKPSTVEVRGGTHNPFAPPFDFLVRALFPLLAQMGPRIEARLHRPGFYPAGGGRASFHITPAAKLAPLSLVRRGEIRKRSIIAMVAELPSDIGAREVDTLARLLGWDRSCGEVVRIKDSLGPGNAVMAIVQCENVTEVFTGFGEKGVTAKKVAKAVAIEATEYLNAQVPVGPHLADQLLLWNALAGAGVFRTVEPTGHTKTQIEVVQMFLGTEVSSERSGDAWKLTVESGEAVAQNGR